jgi:hypothetical protein
VQGSEVRNRRGARRPASRQSPSVPRTFTAAGRAEPRTRCLPRWDDARAAGSRRRGASAAVGRISSRRLGAASGAASGAAVRLGLLRPGDGPPMVVPVPAPGASSHPRGRGPSAPRGRFGGASCARAAVSGASFKRRSVWASRADCVRPGRQPSAVLRVRGDTDGGKKAGRGAPGAQTRRRWRRRVGASARSIAGRPRGGCREPADPRLRADDGRPRKGTPEEIWRADDVWPAPAANSTSRQGQSSGGEDPGSRPEVKTREVVPDRPGRQSTHVPRLQQSNGFGPRASSSSSAPHPHTTTLLSSAEKVISHYLRHSVFTYGPIRALTFLFFFSPATLAFFLSFLPSFRSSFPFHLPLPANFAPFSAFLPLVDFNFFLIIKIYKRLGQLLRCWRCSLLSDFLLLNNAQFSRQFPRIANKAKYLDFSFSDFVTFCRYVLQKRRGFRIVSIKCTSPTSGSRYRKYIIYRLLLFLLLQRPFS